MRIKKCCECGEELYCRSCGKRQTPENIKEKKKQVACTLTERENQEISEAAEKLGIPKTEYIRRMIELGKEKLEGKEKKGKKPKEEK